LNKIENEKFVLGVDFLNAHKAVVNYGDGCENIQLNRPQTTNCFAFRNCRVPANYEAHIKVSVPPSFKANELVRVVRDGLVYLSENELLEEIRERILDQDRAHVFCSVWVSFVVF
jgi:hypothetical protein